MQIEELLQAWDIAAEQEVEGGGTVGPSMAATNQLKRDVEEEIICPDDKAAYGSTPQEAADPEDEFWSQLLAAGESSNLSSEALSKSAETRVTREKQRPKPPRENSSLLKQNKPERVSSSVLPKAKKAKLKQPEGALPMTPEHYRSLESRVWFFSVLVSLVNLLVALSAM